MAVKPKTRPELVRPTLYDLTTEESALLHHLEEMLLAQQAGEGLFDEQLQQRADELIAQLNEAQERRDDKLDRLCAARRRLLAQSVELKAEAERLKSRAFRQEKAAEWIAARIQAWMESADPPLAEVETRSGANRIKLSAAGRAPVVILDPTRLEALPEDCLRVIPETVEPDKDAIYKYLVALSPREGDDAEIEAAVNDLAETFKGIATLGERCKRLSFS